VLLAIYDYGDQMRGDEMEGVCMVSGGKENTLRSGGKIHRKETSFKP
jgi:hypothetical protein